MNRFFKKSVLALGAAFLFIGSPAFADSQKPEFIIPNGDGKPDIIAISDDGLFTLSEEKDPNEGLTTPGGQILDLTTGQMEKITNDIGWCGVSDITNGGKVVVGHSSGKPAYYTRSTKKWTVLPTPSGYKAGRVLNVTPDGHYAVGYAQVDDTQWLYCPVMWDLTTNAIVEVKNLPTKDLAGEDKTAHKFSSISADGRYIIGNMSWFYPGDNFCYLYDRQTGTYDVFGYDKDGDKLTPSDPNIHSIDECFFSPNGKWIAGQAYFAVSSSSSDFKNEYFAGFRYEVATKKYEYFNSDTDSDIILFCITDDGVAMGGTPSSVPLRSGRVHVGNYYYDLEQIYTQAYGVDYLSYMPSTFTISGAPICVSGDGKTIVSLVSGNETYVVRLPEPIQDACARVNLLGNYTITPASGSSFSQLSNLRLVFDRNVGVTGAARHIRLLDENGNSLASASNIDVNGKTISITFSPVVLDAGKKYKITIPAGFVTLAGDTAVKSEPIEIEYIGRDMSPMKPILIEPSSDSSLAILDMTTNPVVVTFEGAIARTEVGGGYLYHDGDDEPLSELVMLVQGNSMLVFPAIGQYLFKGNEYTLVIPEGVVTDISGVGPNEAFEIHYSGTYVPELGDEVNLFYDSCDGYERFMFYEGDFLEPDDVPAAWGFVAGNPWRIIRSSEDTFENAMGAHSMFKKSGTSDDWMVLHNLTIPDKSCFLSFQGQSYLKSKKDVLKIYVYATDEIVYNLNKAFVDKIREKGDLVFDEALEPGATEEGLEDEWTDYQISLEDYAGKNIYIAFVNNNTDQSAVFVDNIRVARDLKFVTTFSNRMRVENLSEIVISPQIAISSEVDTYTAIDAKLLDSEGKNVDTYTASGLSLGNADMYSFSFSKPLPLVKGANNAFSVDITLTAADGHKENAIVSNSIMNLTFTPVKRVVLEEFTGKDCPNCPLGILALENLHKVYGDRFIPIAVKGYNGTDPLGQGVLDYAEFLGMMAAPSGRINRGESVSPMISVYGDYRFSGAGVIDENGNESKVWLDVVNDEMSVPAYAEINATTSYDTKRNLTIDIEVKSALNLESQSISLFAVLTEDNLFTLQANNLGQVDDPDLGEWGKGGIYSGSNVPTTTDHVARATYGRTFNGTASLLPASLEAGQTYKAQLKGVIPESVKEDKFKECHVTVMMIDGGTLKVINAVNVPLGGGVSVDGISAASDNILIRTMAHGQIAVSAPAAVMAEAYDLSGRKIASGYSENGNLLLSTEGYKGVAIVKAVCEGNAKSVKTIIR